MALPDPTIDDLRREIDDIDDAMHDLLKRRARVVEAVGTIRRRETNAAPAIRPAREARILRRLMGRHDGPFPGAVLVRMWRELLAGTARMQGPFAVAVHAPEKSVGYWDLARDHYGSSTQMTLHRSARRVVREVAEGRATVGVLAMPSDGEADPWWPSLMGSEPDVPRIVVRLPFIDNHAGRIEDLRAFAIARLPHESTGQDATLFVVETDGELSRGRLREVFNKAELPGADIAVWADPHAEDRRLHLVEVEGFVEAGEARLGAVEAALGKAIRRIVGLGGYAVPLVAEPRGGA